VSLWQRGIGKKPAAPRRRRKDTVVAQQEKNEREKFELQIRMELEAHFQAEIAKFERQHAQAQKVEYAGQLPKQLDGVQAIAKLKEPAQE
jgi:hypothetical protein